MLFHMYLFLETESQDLLLDVVWKNPQKHTTPELQKQTG
jgi:hypothetical protein